MKINKQRQGNKIISPAERKNQDASEESRLEIVEVDEDDLADETVEYGGKIEPWTQIEAKTRDYLAKRIVSYYGPVAWGGLTTGSLVTQSPFLMFLAVIGLVPYFLVVIYYFIKPKPVSSDKPKKHRGSKKTRK